MTAPTTDTPRLTRTPAEELELRQELLAAVEAIRDVLARTAPESEAAGRLVPEAAAALESAGLLRLHVPREVGGHEASLTTQLLVIAALAEIDAAVAWNTMVNNSGTGFLGAFLPEAALAEVFPPGVVPVAAGVVPPMGRARRVAGGYLLNGRWRTCSGVTQASWIRLTAVVEGEDRTIFAVLPKAEATIHEDSWQVFGLRGTGSFDVSVTDYFVPEHLAVGEEIPQRGGCHYRLRNLAIAAYEHTGLAIGLARRALSEMAALAAKKGNPRDSLLTDLGRLTTEVAAMTDTAVVTFDRIQRELLDPAADADLAGLPGQALAAQATQVALECVEVVYRAAGTTGLYLPNPFEQLMRDIHGASQHIAVSPGHFTALGKALVAAQGSER